MLLWDKKVVELKEQTAEFNVIKEQKNKRIKAATKAISVKTDKLLEQISRYNIQVEKLSTESLRRITLNEKSEYYLSKDDYLDLDEIDDNVIQRWEVNYVRHNLTLYDNECNKLFGRVGKDKAHTLLKNNVLDEIAKMYLHLKKECKRQKIKSDDGAE